MRGIQQRGVYHLPSRILDLLEIAAYVFCADRRITRGRPNDLEYHNWSRSLHFAIKVRDVEFWESCKGELSAALQFMSGDLSHTFSFQPGHKTPPANLFDSEEFQIATDNEVAVTLFSGGLDSAAGVVETLASTDKHICLVSHRSGQTRTARTQNQLFQALEKGYPGRISHYKFKCHLKGSRAEDETQRTRAFLYSAIAFALAHAFSQRRFYVFENGVTAINFSKREDGQNARTSRTAHPKTISLLTKFFARFDGNAIEIATPYLWKTKTDVFKVFNQFGQKDLISSTVSCSQTFQNQATHCGGCSQCVDRKLSSHAAELSKIDDVGIYDFDFINQSVPDTTVRTALSDYIRQAHEFATWNDDTFCSKKMNDLIALLDHIPGMKEDEIVQTVHELCRRHGTQVFAGLKAIQNQFDDLLNKVPPGSLLEIIAAREYITSVGPVPTNEGFVLQNQRVEVISVTEGIQSMKKTVVELDLVGYSTICDNFEQGLDVHLVTELNAQIQEFVDVGLAAVNASREQNVMKTTGDGAILVFDSAADAHSFAVAVHEVTAEHNAPRSQALAKRIFRIGAATGKVIIEPKSGDSFDMAGATIARAVRLEAKASPGGFLIDEATFADLPPVQKGSFGSPQQIAGKRDEIFIGYLSQPNKKGPEDAAFFVTPAQKKPLSPALKIWQEKLEYLEEQEAITSDPTQKFMLRKEIEVAKAKIRGHGG